MIFDNSKLAIIFVILFLIIVTAAFLILRTRFSGQPVAQNDVVTTVTPSVIETPRIITPQVINGQTVIVPTDTAAPVVTASPVPTAIVTAAPLPQAAGSSAVALAPTTGPSGSLPNTSYPAVGIAVLAAISAFIGFRIRKFPQ